MNRAAGLAAVFGVLACCAAGAQSDSVPRGAKSPAARGELASVPNCRVKLLDEVQLASERTGIVDTIVAEGDDVRAGEVVVRLRDGLLRAGHAIVEREASNDVEVRFARKASELAQLKYVRSQEANRSVPGTVSELELRELRLAAEKSLLQLEQAEHHFLIAGLKRDEGRQLLETCLIEAPFDAVVLDVLKRPGEVVREGDPILRIAATGRMRVEGFLPVEQAARVRRGMAVEVWLDGAGSDGAPFTGRLAFVDLKVEPVSQKVRVWAEVANRGDLLRDGQVATLTIRPRDRD